MKFPQRLISSRHCWSQRMLNCGLSLFCCLDIIICMRLAINIQLTVHVHILVHHWFHQTILYPFICSAGFMVHAFGACGESSELGQRCGCSVFKACPQTLYSSSHSVMKRETHKSTEDPNDIFLKVVRQTLNEKQQ